MRHIFFLFLFLLFATLGCQPTSSGNNLQSWLREKEKLRILCTTEIIEDLVKQIGKEQIHTLSLIGPGLDPHSYELVKGDNEKLLAAELVFYNGLGLEHSPGLNYSLKNHPNALAVGDWIHKKNPHHIILQEGIADPHIWMDVSLWSQIITPVQEQLSKALPMHAELFAKRADQLRQNMNHLHHEIQNFILKIPESKRYLISSHDAFQYFSRTYLAPDHERDNNSWVVRCQAPEGLAPESQVSLGKIQEIINHIKKHDIHVIFAETSTSQDSIRKILDACHHMKFSLEIATPGLYSDSLGVSGSNGDTYEGMILHNTTMIAKYLDKNLIYEKITLRP